MGNSVDVMGNSVGVTSVSVDAIGVSVDVMGIRRCTEAHTSPVSEVLEVQDGASVHLEAGVGHQSHRLAV